MTDRLTEIRQRWEPVWSTDDSARMDARGDVLYLLGLVDELQDLAKGYFRQIQMEKLRVERGERQGR